MRVIGMEHKPIKPMKKGKASKNEEIKEPEKVEESENENILKED